MLSLLLILAAQVFMFGRMLADRRHARTVFAVMFAMFALALVVAVVAEQHGSQTLRASGVNITQGNGTERRQPAGQGDPIRQREHRTLRDRVHPSSDGAVNGGLDTFTSVGGAVPLVNIFVGEVIFGGVGSGLYSMLFMIVVAVFVGGLMIGRTPEYLGKKITAREVKLAALGALFVPTMTLALTAFSISTATGRVSLFNPGAHGFTEALYAWTSMANTKGAPSQASGSATSPLSSAQQR